jgi:hypothetical protein
MYKLLNVKKGVSSHIRPNFNRMISRLKTKTGYFNLTTDDDLTGTQNEA